MNDAADTSVQLLRRYRDGDKQALDELLERQIQPMRQWARGRLPRWARDTTVRFRRLCARRSSIASATRSGTAAASPAVKR